VTAVARACFAAYVRGELAGFGVRDADLPDLCHEVFLVVQDKAHVIAVIDRLDLWLRAICRRVAAGHRLRDARRYVA
jgi:DNA-directed RNA polymerase specialized sigma24 family protein